MFIHSVLWWLGCINSVFSPCSMCVLSVYLQVLHLVAMALLEEQQQLENSSGDEDVTFNYTCKITR